MGNEGFTLEEIFYMKARRCRRCGGLLTNQESVKDGYGHICKSKVRADELEEARHPNQNQTTLFDLFGTEKVKYP